MSLRFVITVCGVAALPFSAQAATVTFAGANSQLGTGFGTVLTVLSLQNTPNESGSVLRSGGSDALTGDATNQSQTRTAAEILAAGVMSSNLGVVFNINEPGSAAEVTLQGFTVRFMSSTGTTLFDAAYSATPQVLTAVNNGNGGAGYLFNISLSPSEITNFFGTPTNRIGMFTTNAVLNSAAGAESFYLVPAPGSLALVLAGAGLILSVRRRA